MSGIPNDINNSSITSLNYFPSINKPEEEKGQPQLEEKGQERISIPLAISNVRQETGVIPSIPIGPSNIPSPWKPEALARMKVELKKQVYERKFLRFVNNVLENGVVCSKMAQELKIKQVSSLDKNPRPENEVEVNYFADEGGLNTAIGIGDSGNTAAKGAYSIALERFRDELPATLGKAGLTSQQEEALKRIPPLFQLPMRSAMEHKAPLLFNEESIRILENRAESSILILTTPQDVRFFNNKKQELTDVHQVVNNFYQNCDIGEDATDKCKEIKVNANISSSSFNVVLIPERFRHLGSKFKAPDNCRLVFVGSQTFEVAYNYPPTDETSTNASSMVSLTVPDFGKEVDNFLNEHGRVISHLSKGSSIYDF